MRLTEAEVRLLQETLRPLVADQHIAVFLVGSHAAGVARRSSDLDLLFQGAQPLPSHITVCIDEALEASPLPYVVEILDYHRLTPEFRQRLLPGARRLL